MNTNKDASDVSANRGWLYCRGRLVLDCVPRGAHKKGTGVSLRHAGVCFALALFALPWQARAQKQGADCGEEPCLSGACPLKLPYEEFIAAPPTDRGGRNVPPVSERPFDPESGPKMLVKGFVVDGVTPNPEAGITKESVQAAADAAFARERGEAAEARLTVGHMVKVSDEVTNFYRSKGYLVAKAFLPVQTVGPDSLVHIQVSEGKISEVSVEGAKHYRASVLKKPAERLVGTVPSRDEVETALLYAQDYPGVRLFGTFKPGDKQGETKLVLQVLDETRLNFELGGDNYGTKLTGEDRARVGVNWHNPIGFGDELALSVFQSVNPANTTYGSLDYSVPIGPRGLSATAGYSRNAFIVNEKPFDLLNLDGTITAYDAGANWKYLRGRFANGTVSLVYTHKQSELKGTVGSAILPISNDKIGIVTLDSSMDRIDVRFKGVDQVTARIRRGVNADFGKSSKLNPHFSIYEARYTRVQSLAETQTAILRLRGQATKDPISPLEQFSLAGPDAVRAYPVGQLLKDTGQFASLEYQVQAPGFARAPGLFGRQWGDLLQFALFTDYAHGRSADDKTDQAELRGYGAGIHFGIPGTFQAVVEGAKPMSSSRKASDAKDTRVYFNLTFKF